MSASFKLDKLQFGTLNPVRENDAGATGDRRRTNTAAGLRMALGRAFAKDQLSGIDEFTGIVVHRRDVTYPSFGNRASVLQEYMVAAAQSEEEDDEETPESSTEFPSVVYKVYIPEIEPRPAPKSERDPVLRMYADVYSEIADDLPVGTLVTVRYEDTETLFMPRIIRRTGHIRLDGFKDVPVEGTRGQHRSKPSAPIGNKTEAPSGPRYPLSTFKPSFNWKSSSQGSDRLKWIVIHTTEIATLNRSLEVLSGYDEKTGTFMEREVSANYVVGPGGEIYNMVSDLDASFHAGPSARGVTSFASIGIEVVGYSKDPNTWNAKNTQALADLIGWLTKEYDIPLVYEGLPPGTYAGVESGGTGVQEKQTSGIIAHGTSTDPGRRYDPGIYFPWDLIKEKIEKEELTAIPSSTEASVRQSFAGRHASAPDAPTAQLVLD